MGLKRCTVINDKQGIFHLSFEDENECERVIHDLLGSNDVAIWDNGDGEGYVDIDYILKIEYENGCWGIYYCLEYGPLDKFAIFEIERQSLFAYRCIKNNFNIEPILSHIKDYPSSQLLVGYKKEILTKQFVTEFYVFVNSLNEYYLNLYFVNQTEYKKHPKFEEFQSIERVFMLEITISEYLQLKNELEHLNWILFLIIKGFYPMSKKYDLYQVYTNDEIKVTLNDVFISDNKYHKVINKLYIAELQIELNDVLIIIYKEKKFVVEKGGYNLIKELIAMYNDSWQDGTDIQFYISDDLELIMYNSVFVVIQNAYVSDKVEFRFLDSEIESYESKLQELKGKKYFDHHTEIILGFEDLINRKMSSEKELENYICKHFKIILGKEYSKVRTQIMAKHCVENNSDERRFDVFAFNTARREWDLFELKKSKVKITKTIREMPMFTSKVHESIAQIRYYKKLLVQDTVRQQIKHDYDIDICVPKFTLIIGEGNTPQIKKCQSDINEIEVVTYTQLLEKAKIVAT